MNSVKPDTLSQGEVAVSADTPLRMVDIEAGYFANDMVLSNVEVTAIPNRVTVILGPNGSGKSTTLRVLYGILKPRKGKVLLGDRDITAIPSFQRVNQGIAFLSQGRSVFPDLSVHENLEIGGWALQKNKAQMKAQVEAVYDRYPVLKTMRNRPGGSLSGGQQRILEFARMMVADPKIILIDEPSVGLAPILVDQVYQEIANLKKENRTILLVDQNVRAAVALADYIYTLEYGRNNLQGETGKFEGALEELIKSWLRF